MHVFVKPTACFSFQISSAVQWCCSNSSMQCPRAEHAHCTHVLHYLTCRILKDTPKDMLFRSSLKANKSHVFCWSQEEQQVIFKVAMKERPAIPDDTIPGGLASLIERCWDHQQNVRPSFEEVDAELSKISGSSVWTCVDFFWFLLILISQLHVRNVVTFWLPCRRWWGADTTTSAT